MIRTHPLVHHRLLPWTPRLRVRRWVSRWLGCWGVCLLMQSASAEVLLGRVVGVTDGDTVTVLNPDNRPVKVRLAGIDAPERKQAFGQRSKDTLAQWVAGQSVTVSYDKTDRYGRVVGKIEVDGQDINRAMLSSGMAWFYRKYAHELTAVDRVLYEAAETTAKEKRLGLWVDAAPIPPWDWRRP